MVVVSLSAETVCTVVPTTVLPFDVVVVVVVLPSALMTVAVTCIWLTKPLPLVSLSTVLPRPFGKVIVTLWPVTVPLAA